MALHESDREDLMREATALRERIELHLPSTTEPVVAGYHGDGRLAIYFGQETALHFDDAGRLRRAFAGDRLYRSQGTTLARLTRQRTEGTTELLRHDLDPQELRDFMATIARLLADLRTALERETAQVVQQVPAEANLLPRLIESLTQILDPEMRLAAALKR